MVPTGNNRSDIGADGGQIGLFLGYDRIFPNKWLLGLEAGAQWTDISGKSRTSFTVPRTGTFPGVSVFSRTRFKSDWSYDLAVRLGRKVYECSLWYVKLGAQWTHFKLRSHDHVRNLTTGASSSGRHNKRHKYRTGFLAGAGVEVPVACHWSLGAEYNFTWYQRVSSHRRDGNGTNDFGRARIRPYQNQILARVIFRQ
jgi:high affinity Mn2+ porin